MKKFEIIYMDGYDQVVDYNTNEVIFSTKGIESSVIDNVVIIWNEIKTTNLNLGSGGILDGYLFNEGLCTQEQRDLIVENLYRHAVK
jgi:hypothetical protein